MNSFFLVVIAVWASSSAGGEECMTSTTEIEAEVTQSIPKTIQNCKENKRYYTLPTTTRRGKSRTVATIKIKRAVYYDWQWYWSS